MLSSNCSARTPARHHHDGGVPDLLIGARLRGRRAVGWAGLRSVVSVCGVLGPASVPHRGTLFPAEHLPLRGCTVPGACYEGTVTGPGGAAVWPGQQAFGQSLQHNFGGRTAMSQRTPRPRSSPGVVSGPRRQAAAPPRRISTRVGYAGGKKNDDPTAGRPSVTPRGSRFSSIPGGPPTGTSWSSSSRSTGPTFGAKGLSAPTTAPRSTIPAMSSARSPRTRSPPPTPRHVAWHGGDHGQGRLLLGGRGRRPGLPPALQRRRRSSAHIDPLRDSRCGPPRSYWRCAPPAVRRAATWNSPGFRWLTSYANACARTSAWRSGSWQSTTIASSEAESGITLPLRCRVRGAVRTLKTWLCEAGGRTPKA